MSDFLHHIYLIRHGQTTAEPNLIMGSTDVPLSKEGIKQAKKLKKTISQATSANIYTSELLRAKQTAELVLSDDQPPPCSSSLLNEMDFGEWDNQQWDQAYQQDPDYFNYWAENWINVPPPKGECFADVAERCEQWLNEIEVNDTLIVFAHAGSLRALLCILLNLPFDCAFNFEFSHCHVTRIQLSEQQSKLMYFNSPVFI